MIQDQQVKYKNNIYIMNMKESDCLQREILKYRKTDYTRVSLESHGERDFCLFVFFFPILSQHAPFIQIPLALAPTTNLV